MLLVVEILGYYRRYNKLNQFRGFWTKRKSKSRNVRAFMLIYHFLTFPLALEHIPGEHLSK